MRKIQLLILILRASIADNYPSRSGATIVGRSRTLVRADGGEKNQDQELIFLIVASVHYRPACRVPL